MVGFGADLPGGFVAIEAIALAQNAARRYASFIPVMDALTARGSRLGQRPLSTCRVSARAPVSPPRIFPAASPWSISSPHGACRAAPSIRC